ncbi:MAG: hypothetical protein R2712_07510 [Vicinamibacterales bacterium]
MSLCARTAEAGICVPPFAAGSLPPDTEPSSWDAARSDDNPASPGEARTRAALSSLPPSRHRGAGADPNAVVAGGVGKTTTTALLTWVLERAGLAPDYLIGGIVHGLDTSCRLAGATIAVIEGDEYASGPGDDALKFSHYRLTWSCWTTCSRIIRTSIPPTTRWSRSRHWSNGCLPRGRSCGGRATRRSRTS